MEFEFIPHGVCSQRYYFEIDENTDTIKKCEIEAEQVNGGKIPSPYERKERRGPSKPHPYSGLMICPKCGETILPHRVCPNCGYPDGK